MVPHIVQVLNGIYSIGPIQTVGTGRVSATSPFLVVGERAAVVEPGEHSQVKPFLEGVKEIGVDLDIIDYIIPSHLHLHHCSSLNYYMKDARFQKAKVLIHERGVQHALDPTRLNASTQQAFGGECKLALDPVPQDRIISVAGGEVFDLGGRELEIIDAPGHAPHGFAIFDRLTKGLVCGDFPEFKASSKRGVVHMSLPFFHAERTLESVRRFRACHPLVLLKWYGGIAHYQPELLLRTLEEDVIAIEQIALEGMKQKLTVPEIVSRVKEYQDRVGASWQSQEEEVERTPQPMGGIGGLFRYLEQKHPGLEIPRER